MARGTLRCRVAADCLFAEPSAGWRKSPAYGAGSRHRCGSRAAACAGACREYGEPPGALRLTVLTFCTPADRGWRPVAAYSRTGRDPQGYVKALLSRAFAGYDQGLAQCQGQVRIRIGGDRGSSLPTARAGHRRNRCPPPRDACWRWSQVRWQGNGTAASR